MLTHKDFLEFENDLLKNKGMNLQTRIDDDDDAPGKVERFIDRVVMLVENEVKRHNKRFDFNAAPEPQQQAFYEACLEQAMYLYLLGDMSLINGFDPISNTIIDIEEVRKRAFSPTAKQLLLNAGLLYRGLSNNYDGGPVPGYGRRW